MKEYRINNSDELSLSGFEGKVIYKASDEFGDIIVAEGGMTRSMYFKAGAIQSSMFVDFPDDIALYYVRAMMSALVFNRRPRRILIIGLGGGAGVKFLLRLCPECMVDAVEIRQKVIDVAKDFFDLPVDNKNLNVMCMDGRDFIKRCCSVNNKFDHIFIDAYDTTSGMDALMEKAFLDDCRKCLCDEGLLTINLWTGPAGNYLRRRREISGLFPGGTLELVLPGERANAIIFGLNSAAIIAKDFSGFEHTAQEMAEASGINFPMFLQDIYHQNQKTFPGSPS